MLPVYVVHWCAPRWCEDTVTSLCETGARVTVVHNGGELPRLNGSVRVIDSGGNLGYTGGANIALRDFLKGAEPWCVITSHDLAVAPNTFERMLRVARPGVGIIGPTLDGPTATDWLSGSCLMISRECVRKVGYFDERFGSYCEDVDYCHRAIAAGFELVRAARAPASTRGSASPAARRAIFTNQILIAHKEQGWIGGLRRWATHGKEAAYRARAGEWDRAADHVIAMVHGARHLFPTRDETALVFEPHCDR